MHLKCLLSLHEWNGCKCTACGKTRDDGHDWSKDCEKCAQCGLSRENVNKGLACKCLMCSRSVDKASTVSTRLAMTPTHRAAETTGASHIERVIADLKELDLKIKPLAQNTWPNTPQWNQLMLLSNQQAVKAKSLKHSDILNLETYLKSPDAETRSTAAYIIKVLHLDSPTEALPMSTVALLGSLLRDSNDTVRNSALDALYHMSKSADIGAAATDLVTALDVTDKERRLNIIEMLGVSRKQNEIVVEALQCLKADDSPDIATAARQALDKLGVNPGQEDEKAAIQKLIWTWKSSGYGHFQTDAARDELITFPNPIAVCKTFKETLLKGDWNTGFIPGDWPESFCEILADIGDERFLDDLFDLYKAFEANTSWSRWSGYFAVAILRLPGGWDCVRRDLTGDEATSLIIKAVTCFTFGADKIADYEERLSLDEKLKAIASIMASDDTVYGRCESLRRIGITALDQLLTIYRSAHSQAAADVICQMPGALDSLLSQLAPKDIEGIIALRYEYTSGWNENLVRFMAKLNTPRCIEWLKSEALPDTRDNAVTAQLRKELVSSLLAGA